MLYHLENHLERCGTIYYTGKRPLGNGTLVPDFSWDPNKDMIFDDYEEAKKARDDWGGTSIIAKHA